MNKQQKHLPLRYMKSGLLATLVALCLTLFVTVAAFASTVNISDRAGVLDANRVRSDASSLPYRVDIYTTSSFQGTGSELDQQAKNSIPNANTVVIVISTNIHHISIVGGDRVNLQTSDYENAVNAFISSYKSNHNYTDATIASIDSLKGSSGVSGGLGGLFSGAGTSFCCIGLVVLALIAVFAIVRGRRRNGFFNRGPMYGPNYPPANYGPGYPQNQGMNPWAAGGLGAAAGGFLGYELGKEEGEREERRREEEGFFGGGDFGGGAGGDFGGGGNFGGGDFGGGAGGDFGGGGGDFGGGAGGNF